MVKSRAGVAQPDSFAYRRTDRNARTVVLDRHVQHISVPRSRERDGGPSVVTLPVLDGMGILRAQGPSGAAPAYVIANAEAVTDSATLAKYGAAVGKTISDFGGHLIVRGAIAVRLDSSPLPKGAFVIVQFPSMQALQNWWNSPEYVAIRPYRERPTIGHVFALEGIPAPGAAQGGGTK
jgi:uncharacterized protein (DUF1330 family)